MKKISVISARIDARIKVLADKWCQSKGLVLARFLEEAILDKLEEAEDSKEIQKLKREPTRPIADVLKELKNLH